MFGGQLTAFFIIGPKAHFYQQLSQVYLLNLYELEDGSLRYVYRPQSSPWRVGDVVYIPTKEDLFREGLLIIARHYLQDQEIIDAWEIDSDDGVYDFHAFPKPLRDACFERVANLDFSAIQIDLLIYKNSQLHAFVDDVKSQTFINYRVVKRQYS